jgi:lambda family phage portal protein
LMQMVQMTDSKIILSRDIAESIIRERINSYRAAHRNMPGMAMQSSLLESASTSARFGSWGLSSTGPNTAIERSLAGAVNRSHEMVRNNPIAFNGIDKNVTNLIGASGITPRWVTDDEGLNKELEDLWNDQKNYFDHDGVYDFCGLQELIAWAWLEGGEALVKYNFTADNDDTPIQFQIMEGAQLNTSYITGVAKGNRASMGIELSPGNKRVAYHVYGVHPSDSNFNLASQSLRIPATEISHIYKPTRPGQLRGVPILSVVTTMLYKFANYIDAELERKATAALFSLFVTSPSGELNESGIPGLAEIGTNTQGETQTYLTLEPGIIQNLKPGEDIKPSEPADVGANIDPWMRNMTHIIAQGMSLAHFQLTGDLSQANYASSRVGLLDVRRKFKMMIKNIITFQFCRAAAIKWMDANVLTGRIKIKKYGIDKKKYQKMIWDPDGWDWTDPDAEISAIQKEIRAGLKTRTQALGERGKNIITIDDERERENKRADEKGLVFDSDPRQTTQAGMLQQIQGGK